MAISATYSFEFHTDSRTCFSLGSASALALGALAILVTLTYFKYLPDMTYPIAGGVALSSLLVGGLGATLRRKTIEAPPYSRFFHPLKEGLAPTTPTASRTPLPQQPTPVNLTPTLPIAEIRPSFEEALKTATHVSVHPDPHQTHPPSELHPFPTRDFTMKLTVDGKLWSYTVPVAQFRRKKENRVEAILLQGQTFSKIVVDEEKGGGFDPWGSSWYFEGLPRVESLNATIRCPGYLSLSKAWQSWLSIQANQAANYFMNGGYCKSKEKKTSTLFEVPGLQSTTYRDKTVTFTRDSTIPLINPDQLALLKNSDVEWYQRLALQLENSVWTCDIHSSILSIESEAEEVTVYTLFEFKSLAK